MTYKKRMNIISKMKILNLRYEKEHFEQNKMNICPKNEQNLKKDKIHKRKTNTI